MDRPASPPDLSSALEKILANPELISMVASTLGGSAPSPSSAPQEEAAPEGSPSSSEEEKQETDTSVPVGLSDRFSTLAPLLSSLSIGGKGGNHKGKEDHRACLLRALKPYLNPARREAIDYMIRLSELSDLLKHLY